MIKKKIILLGDSITQGLGSRKVNFTQTLQDKLENCFVVENMALTGTTILYAKKILNSIISRNPDYVIILYGNVDAQIRPNRQGAVFPHIPERFRKNGMLMPRPFYSHTFLKMMGQKIDNILRKLFSEIIYKIDGSEQWVDKELFKETYDYVVQKLLDSGSQVVTCSTVFIDDIMFPGSLNQYMIFNREIADISEKYQCAFIDLYNSLAKVVQKSGWEAYYNYDHFHPNTGGYELISSILAGQIQHDHINRR